MALSCAFNFLVILLCILGNLAVTLSHGKPDTLRIIKLLHAKALFGVKYLRPGMIIATHKTQNNLECSPDEIRQHYDLAKAAILAELFRWASKNPALRRQNRKGC